MLACTDHADEFAGIDIFAYEVLHRRALRYRLSAFGTPGNHEKIELVLMMYKVYGSEYSLAVLLTTHRRGRLRREVSVRKDVDPARALGEGWVLFKGARA